MSEHETPSDEIERWARQKAAQAWGAMTEDIKFALRRRLFEMNPILAIREIGRHYKDGVWSITPYPDVTEFGQLGLRECKLLHDRLCDRSA